MINPHDEKCEPLVSVIIPTKNRCSLLERAIKSVLVQNYDNIEIIIIDEASDDATSEHDGASTVTGMVPSRLC